jgi:hypothetical protein
MTGGVLSPVGPAADTPTPVPAHRLRLQGDCLHLAAGDRTCVGQVSGMELLGGWLYGVARGKTAGDDVCVRVLLGKDGDIVAGEGQPPRWHRCLDLAHLFERLGHRQEALFLAQRALRWHPSDRGSTPQDSVAVRIDKLLGGVARLVPPDAPPTGTTTQAAMAWMTERNMHCSPDPLVRRDVAGYVARLTRETLVAQDRFAGVALEAVNLLDDVEPAVRAEAAASFDFLCGQLIEDADYETALLVANTLASRSINLDVQRARLWLCLSALGREEEGESAWAACLKLGGCGPPPLQRAIERTAYPSTMPEWRAFQELNLVSAHRAAAAGRHPSKELQKKGRRLQAPERSPEDWLARAEARLVSVAATVADWVKAGPAQVVGPVIAALMPPYQHLTGRDVTTGESDARCRSLSYAVYGRPYRTEGVTIEAAGRFERAGGGAWVLREQTSTLNAVDGLAFGVVFRVTGTPPARVLPARVLVSRGERPTAATTDRDFSCYIAIADAFVVKPSPEDLFDRGVWRIRVELFDADPAPSDSLGWLSPPPPPARRGRIGSAEHEFVLV